MKPITSTTGGYYSTKELAQLFHADESTIKRWANRSKLKCFKTPGGHRKFTSEHILEFIRTYHYELDAQVNRVAASWDVAPPEKSPGVPAEAVSTPAAPAAMEELFLALARKSDTPNLVEILHRSYLAHEPLGAIYEHIVGAAARGLERLQISGEISSGEENRAMRAMMDAILQFRLLTPRTLPNGKTAMCSSMTGGAQGIMLLCACHLLETRGWTVYYLGHATSSETLMKAVKKYHPDLVCIPIEYKPTLHFTNGSQVVYFDYFHGAADAVDSIAKFEEATLLTA